MSSIHGRPQCLSHTDPLSAHQPYESSGPDCQGHVAGHNPTGILPLPGAKPACGGSMEKRDSIYGDSLQLSSHMPDGSELLHGLCCAHRHGCNRKDNRRKITGKYFNDSSDPAMMNPNSNHPCLLYNRRTGLEVDEFLHL